VVWMFCTCCGALAAVVAFSREWSLGFEGVEKRLRGWSMEEEKFWLAG